MILSIIGIVLGAVAIGLFVWFRKDQEMTTDLLDSDIRGNGNAFIALQEEFTQYQIDNERKIADFEKQLSIKFKEHDRRMDKMNKSLPSVIRTVVGHIEFARPLDKK